MTAENFPQEAYDVLVRQVHAPVFFQKLASDYNIVPETDEERFSLLELAGLLANGEAQASQHKVSPILEASDNIKRAMSHQGLPSRPTSRDRLVKQAAQEITQDPGVAQAALEFGRYLYAG